MTKLCNEKIWLLIIYCSIPLAFFGLNYSGFCFLRMRWLSKEEKIEAVFNYYNSRSTLPADTFRDGILTIESYNHIKYSNFEEYIEKHPNCCVVNPEGGYDLASPSFIDRIFGFNSGDVVVVKFKIRYLDKSNRIKTKEFTTENFVSNCGKVYK